MKNVLLITTGYSPQIITETLCYYSQKVDPIHFDEVHVVTGTVGKDRIMQDVLGGPNYFDQYCQDYNIEKNSILFNEDSIHLLMDENQSPLADMKTVNENKAAINQVFRIVSELTDDENVRLFTSVAGGRKTMSVIMGQAMQFYARERDRIIHVIVEDDIMSSNFYYPTPYEKIVQVNGQDIDFSKVTLYLDELPFIRLRPIIGPLLIDDGNSSLVDMVKVAQTQIEDLTKSPEVVINLHEKSLTINDLVVSLPVKNLAFYCALLKLKLDDAGEGNDGFLPTYDMVNEYEDGSFLQLFLNYYVMMYGENRSYVINEKEKFNNKAYDDPWFRQTKSKINKSLRESLSYSEHEFSKITKIGPSNDARHGVSIEKESISINQR